MLGRRSRPPQSLAEFMFDAIKNKKPVDIYVDAITSSIDVKSGSSIIFDLIDRSAKGVFNIGTHTPYSKSDLFKKIAVVIGDVSTHANFVEAPQFGVRRNCNLGLCVKKAELKLGYSFPSLDQVVKNLRDVFELSEV